MSKVHPWFWKDWSYLELEDSWWLNYTAHLYTGMKIVEPFRHYRTNKDQIVFLLEDTLRDLEAESAR